MADGTGIEIPIPEPTASQTQYATLDYAKTIDKKVDKIAEGLAGMKITVEGHIVGAQRVPGLVDIVGDAVTSMKQIKWILAGVGFPVIVAVVLSILQVFGVVHGGAH